MICITGSLSRFNAVNYSNSILCYGMKNSIKEKSSQLGINFSTASNRLRRNVMFHLLCKTGENTCHRCGKKIEIVDDLSIDHKQDWMYAKNAKELFYDIDNIAYSHKRCNTIAGLDKRTPFRGVTRLHNNKKKQYQARYWDGEKQVFLGYYATAEEAAEKVLNCTKASL